MYPLSIQDGTLYENLRIDAYEQRRGDTTVAVRVQAESAICICLSGGETPKILMHSYSMFMIAAAVVRRKNLSRKYLPTFYALSSTH